jgi:hypothetical protein
VLPTHQNPHPPFREDTKFPASLFHIIPQVIKDSQRQIETIGEMM